MTSVPPTQPPAAPETDVRLREALHRAFHDHWGRPNEPLDLYADSPLWKKQAEAVERIVAERVRVVEGERDAEDAAALYWAARAESAEAAHRALQAAVEALADEWQQDADGLDLARDGFDGVVNLTHRGTLLDVIDDLRALLAGGAR